MARPQIGDTLAAECASFADLKLALPFDTPTRSVDRAALTHASWCPTCRPIADRHLRAQAARTEALAAEARTEAAARAVDILDDAAKIIETNGYFRHYLWDTGQNARGTPIECCRVDIIGAISIAAYGSPTYAGAPRVLAAESYLTKQVDAPSIAAWSCRPGNGQQQALDLIRSTADALRAATPAARRSQ